VELYVSIEERRRNDRERAKRWREANPELARERSRDSVRRWRERHPERNRESKKRWAEANPDLTRKWSRQSARRYREANPELVREQYNKWREANLEQVRTYEKRRHFKRCYGITVEQRDAMIAAQDNKCAACRSDDPGHKRGWVVDHCHKAGDVRAVLCHPCNVSLGMMKEDAARLRALADYADRALTKPRTITA
jgi:hypothetical protein